MLDTISEFLYKLFGSYEIATMVSSMIPLLELKGGICFGIRNALSWYYSYLFAFIGSTIMFFPIFFLLRPILNALKKVKWFNSFANKCETYIQNKADETANKQGKKQWSAETIKLVGVFLFVAIPLPMTGVYMGTAIATFLDIKFYKAFLMVFLGNIVAGGIITILAVLCIDIIDYILYGLFILAIVILVITIIKIKKSSKNKESNV